ncbi:MAG: cytochrome c oxidase accessory protein CcoG [Sphingomonadales bacterium 35-56-22]|jgi:cytochrome c oxidase accessory protein FixG|uniref:cytochrome c oxidase accessory protein CcoG n=1 Tax=Sphingorhabdus sp. TaxID=1902408 RepID=UPI000BCBA6DA|nr:cytochrome c oxidase accessory protein CcoG [Sphingorhabdus sp.]OYY15031.1 MAG: cytochrome c oxidase accessory protein CcoG [Sphingomonadales bacterium 35-56-22]OYY96531.1 MAG: cytochrome c oxidase accessory protein CcoG [Sphingomonadales bacterium 28-56-43]OYZ60000.1 MAG: cytochrome c oxidase accessory protein CcoG [Sphingomonadales bacterium 24-56-14]OZA82178.1 MAG: cytochrome c oxidase accessory protein CcoG [Sphingomonadales bacterium 39-57-19]HQS13387.1 cytochrome c oxidase accessory p
MSNPKDLTGPNQPLYEARKGVYPKAVDGFFRRLKWGIMAVTLAVYYITPWLRWDRGPYAPDQAVLIDLANRRFYMFQIEIWPHEFYYVVGLLVMAGIGLFLVTSAVGRAWCGYACPQTVWTDLFLHVERYIDGDRNAQTRLEKAPWGPQKIAKRLGKWSVWLFIAFWTGGAWIMYFADAPTLVRDFWSGEAAPVAYATIGILTATTFIFGGFMREQVCIYMCPWPRIQTAMMDEKSLLVTYKEWRGEKRGSLKAAQADPAAFGDCIDCNQCVAVCPTGIDIREGPQIGCITCALCIDACDNVMAQIGKPRGLINYCTLDDAEVEKAGGTSHPVLKTLFRSRTLIYFGIWVSIGLAMLFTLGQRTRLDLAVQPDRNPVYVRLSDGSIRNNYTLKIRNMETRPRIVDVYVEGLPGAVVWTPAGKREFATQHIQFAVAPDAVHKVQLFVAAPAEGPEHSAFTISTIARTGDESGDSDTVVFERPEREKEGEQ